MQAYLKKANETKVLQQLQKGYPWIFASDVANITGEIISGGIVTVIDSNGNFLARGYLNIQSKILIRLLTLVDEEIDEDFWYQRIRKAYSLRKDLNKTAVCRLIFSEADYLPGLVVDKYGDYLVIQSTTAGIDRVLPIIEKHLRELFNPKGIYLRSDIPIRTKEGLELKKGFLGKPFEPIIKIEENGVKLEIDLENGQKTGYFLDQQENRCILGTFSADKTILDCYSHTGGFALNALKNHAKFVTAVDISELATKQIKKNAELNNFINLEIVTEDVMRFLPELVEANKKYDIVVLDPPAFTKTKDSVKTAYNGYKKINQLAMQVVEDGGYLFTFSCSRYMTRTLFLEMLQEAAIKAKRRIQIIEERMQSKDHPMLLGSENSYYLKCFILRVNQ